LSRRAERQSGRRCAGAPHSDACAVELDHVVKRFGKITAIDDISLTVRAGELMTLLGPSGCGKTTLLNLVAGFLMPDSGEIGIAGTRVTQVPTHRREIGMMFQSYALFPHMSVAGNVGYGLKMRRLGKSAIARRVAETLSLMKLDGLHDRKPRQLSGGQQQRAALARALVIRPRVLLLDEPFSALDRNLRASMQVEIKELQRQLGVTTIFVTHDQSEALTLSDRIAVLAEGRIRQLGTPQEIYRSPADRFVASFVGDVNVLRARLERIEGETAILMIGALPIAVPGRTLEGARSGAMVDLFIRPEDTHVTDARATAVASGTVAAQIFQGGHIDLYVDVLEAPSRRVLVRLPGHQSLWPTGSRVSVGLAAEKAIAFAAPTEAGS
jgi:putative spermidine/putrescine transport system ATP-binding protein/spermidine/putrescine transport system ATP-binding protein